jgi:hypothetical protein
MTAAENTEKEAHDGGYVPACVAPAAPMDIGAVIANALKAAGLMKAT